MAITAARDKLRLELGDVDSTAPLFNDDELDYFLTAENNDILNSALRACYAAARKYARAYDFETDGQAFKRGQQATAWLAQAKALEAQGATISAVTSVSTVDITKVDGYSDDVGNTEVLAGGTANPRQRYYWRGQRDDPYL